MNKTTTTAFHLTLILFVLALGRGYWVGARRTALAAAIVVAGFMIVHVFYQVDNYYPRHIVVMYLMMGVFSTILFSRLRDKSL